MNLKIKGPLRNDADYQLFSDKMIHDLKTLHDELEPHRKKLLAKRQSRQEKINGGALPSFETTHPAHTKSWTVAPIPEDCLTRRVEITGPVSSRKMVIQMLSEFTDGAIADMAMLDFEDSMMPSWDNVLDGLHNVLGAINKNLTYTETKPNGTTKTYTLNPNKMAHVMVRVRGLHMNESQVTVGNTPVCAGLFDLYCCAALTARTQIDRGETPMFYVPKIEHYEEATWWNQLFTSIENILNLPHGTLRVTALIETLPAAFQVEEILFELRERALGFNGGRWDKIFSDIKVLKNHSDHIMADRSYIDMTRPWMDNYAKRIIKICHKHGAFALGGMSAFTPGREEATRIEQTEKVRIDKARESEIGHDGCWVSHPYFIKMAKDQFKTQNQLNVQLDDFPDNPDLLPLPEGPKTIQGLRKNIRVGIAYQKGWNDGNGCIAIDNMMEDLATMEISRAQVWQWRHFNVSLDTGETVTSDLINTLFNEEFEKLISENAINESSPEHPSWIEAKTQANTLFLADTLADFFES